MEELKDKEKTGSPTPFWELNKLLEELVTGITSVLKDNFFGAYLQGSFAVGDFDRDSDVDFIIVSKREIDYETVDQLQVIHAYIFDKNENYWSQHLEGTYFPLKAISEYPERGDEFPYLDNGSRKLCMTSHCNTLVVRWILREKAKIIRGIQPMEFIKYFPDKMLRTEIFHAICEWGKDIMGNPDKFRNRFYQGFIVLSFCRMFHDLITATINSKKTCADWAKINLDPVWKDLINRTWATRHVPEKSVNEPPDEDDFARTLIFVDHVIELSNKWMSESTP
ncbi:nucleotidyltransferase domain-containing protein [candidate division WOR-3 bacterium]|nr:nucleotidyltransferase domain-containing protein [candidate division WOR-3 bacterium]